MSAPIKYVMHGQMPTAPYQDVSWAVYNAPDDTGASSGYGANFLINIYVDYTIQDNVISGGNQQAAQAPVPEPVVPIVPQITYVMKALCSSIPTPNQLVTWRSENLPDFTGTESGFPISSLSNIVVDYTINDNVTSGPSANGITLAVGGDLSGFLPSPTVVGLQTNPISTNSPSSGQVLEWNGSEWIPTDQPTLDGDVTGAFESNVIAKLQGNPVSASSPIADQILTWDGYAWIPSTGIHGPAGGDLDGYYPNPTVIKIQGNPISSTPPTAGDFLIENFPATGASWRGITGDASSSSINPGFLTVTALQGKAIDPTAPSVNEVLTWNGTLWTHSTGVATNLFGDVTGSTLATTVTKFQNRAFSATAPTDGYVIAWVAANNDWEPRPISSGSVTLAGDVTGAATANTVGKIQNKAVSATAPTTNDVFLWTGSAWTPTQASLLPVVTWNHDLTGSTNANQYVTNISGDYLGSNKVTLGATLHSITLGGLNAPNASIIDTSIEAQHSSVAGTGANLNLRAGNAASGSAYSGGDINIMAGRAGDSASDSGAVYFKRQNPAPATSSTTFGIIAHDLVSFTPLTTSATSSITLNSGTGGTGIYSAGNIGITSDDLITINGANGVRLQYNGSTVLQVISAGIVRFVSAIGAFNNTTNSAVGWYVDGASTSGDATSISISAQAGSTTANGGHVYIKSGAVTGAGSVGNIYIKTGNSSVGSGGTNQVIITPTDVTLASLAGSGVGLVGVDNSGVLSFSAGAPPSGTAGGDLSGTYPNPTVKSLTGSSGTINIASTGANLRWAAASVTPTIDQADAASGNGANLSLIAQTATAGGTTGGNLLLKSGAGTSANGTVAFITGASIRGQFSGAGVFRVNGLSTGIAHVDSSGDFTSSAVNLATGDVTGTLPTGNQAAQSMGGDISGTTASATVDKIKGTTVTTAGGSLTTGQVLRVTGAATSDWGALDLANTSAVTGALPNANQAAQTMGGDVTGTTAASVVEKLRGTLLATSIASVGSAQDGYTLTWVNGSSEWQAKPGTGSGSTVTWANDLAGSTDTNQYVAAISGNAGGGGSIPINATTLAFASGQSAPAINQATISSATGQTLTISAQPATGATHNGGDLVLAGGTSGSASTGKVILKTGATTGLTVNADSTLTFASLGTGVVQSDSSGNITSTSTSSIPVSYLTAGTANQVLIGSAAPTPTWYTLSGDVTNVLGVMTVGKIKGTTITTAGGSLATGAVLRVTGAATADWGAVDLADTDAVTGILPKANQGSQDMAGDVTGSTAASTVVKLRGTSLATAIASIGATQDGYALTWVNGSSEWQAKPGTGSGSGITALTGDVTASGTGSVAATVVKLYGNAIQNTGALGATQDGYVLTWVNANNEWEPKPDIGFSKVSSFITVNYTITASDEIVQIGTLTGSITLTLPSSPNTGQTHVIKVGVTCQKFIRNVGGTITSVGQNVTVSPASGTIDGLTSYVMNQPYQALTVVYNGSEWAII